MNTRRPLSLSFAAVWLASFVASSPVAAQTSRASRPSQASKAVLEQVKTLEAAIKDRKFAREKEAIDHIDELLGRYDSLHEKSQRKFVGALKNVYRAKKRKPTNAAIYVATAAALGEVGGSDGFKVLKGAWNNKAFSKRKEWASLQDQLLEAIGKTGDKNALVLLLDEASDAHEDGIKLAAGRALRHFSEHTFKQRKLIVKELIQAFTNIENGARDNLNQDPTVETRKRTLRAIADPWNQTLAEMTGESFRTAAEWRSWWNDYKNKPKKWKHQTGS